MEMRGATSRSHTCFPAGDTMGMPNNLLRRRTCRLWWAVAAGAFVASPIAGQTETALRGFHLGLTLPSGGLGATMQKTVDNTDRNTLVPEPRRGKVFRDEVSGDGFTYGVGAVGGYRLPFSGGRWFLEGEVGIEWHGGSTEAQFAGVGVSAERRQLGESWPDRWILAKSRSYGATLRLGGDPGGLDSQGFAVYLLAGVRLADVQLTSHYTGCFSPEPCEPAEFGSGRNDRDLDLMAWMAGVGLERSLGERVAIRAEAGYAMYAREEWVTRFDDFVFTVTPGVDASEVGLSLGLVRFF